MLSVVKAWGQERHKDIFSVPVTTAMVVRFSESHASSSLTLMSELHFLEDPTIMHCKCFSAWANLIIFALRFSGLKKP